MFKANWSVKRHKANLLCSANTTSLCKSAHSHDEVEKDFPTMAMAMSWIKEIGLAAFFAVSQSRPTYKQLVCRQHRVKTKRPSSLKCEDCPAFLNIAKVTLCNCQGLHLTQSNDCHSISEVYRVKGCKTHSRPRNDEKCKALSL